MSYGDLDRLAKQATENQAQVPRPSTLGGLLGGTTAANRGEPQLMVAAKRHAELLQVLGNKLGVLYQRLDPVMRPTPPQAGAERADRGGLAGLASMLHQASDSVESDIAIVSEMIECLEL
jgi:hypothetical protein